MYTSTSKPNILYGIPAYLYLRYLLPLILLFCLLPFYGLQAQEYNYQQYDFRNDLMIQSKSIMNTVEYKDIKGDPYSSLEMKPGAIELANGDRIVGLPMRYNWYSKKMEAKLDDQIIELKNTNEIRHIELENNKYVPFFKVPTLGGYLIELHTGEYNLYRQVSVELREAQPAESSYEDSKPARFLRVDPVFIVISSDGTIIKISSSKKSLAKQIPDHEEDIITYIKKNKTNLKDEAEVIELVQEMESW